MTLKTSLKQGPEAKLLQQLASNWPFAKNILNFGCAQIPDLEKYLTNYHKQIINVTNYDPTVADIKLIDREFRHFDVMICANVLNVHKDLDSILLDLQRIDFDTAIIQVFEGNRSGKGRNTRGRYQRNEKVSDYMQKIVQYFYRHDVTLHRSDALYVVEKGKRYYHIDDINEVDQIVKEVE